MNGNRVNDRGNALGDRATCVIEDDRPSGGIVGSLARARASRNRRSSAIMVLEACA